MLLNVLNSLRKSDKMLGKPRILSFSPTRLINSIKHRHSCKILYKYKQYMKSEQGCTYFIFCTVPADVTENRAIASVTENRAIASVTEDRAITFILGRKSFWLLCCLAYVNIKNAGACISWHVHQLKPSYISLIAVILSSFYN